MTSEMIIKSTEDRVKEFRVKQNKIFHRKQRLSDILEKSGVLEKGAIILTKEQLIEMVDILMEGEE